MNIEIKIFIIIITFFLILYFIKKTEKFTNYRIISVKNFGFPFNNSQKVSSKPSKVKSVTESVTESVNMNNISNQVTIPTTSLLPTEKIDNCSHITNDNECYSKSDLCEWNQDYRYCGNKGDKINCDKFGEIYQEK